MPAAHQTHLHLPNLQLHWQSAEPEKLYHQHLLLPHGKHHPEYCMNLLLNLPYSLQFLQNHQIPYRQEDLQDSNQKFQVLPALAQVLAQFLLLGLQTWKGLVPSYQNLHHQNPQKHPNQPMNLNQEHLMYFQAEQYLKEQGQKKFP